MMSNLFSIFDPHSNLKMSLNWLILVAPLIYFKSIWLVKDKISSLLLWIHKTLNKELTALLSKHSLKSPMIILLSLFIFIMLMNMISLIPYVYNPTSHLVLDLMLSLPIWIGVIFYGWANNTLSMLSHLVPQSTPYGLMSFMVLIELTSNIIRPLTLSIRLTANMVAGHLLITLVCNQISTESISKSLILMTPQLMLMFLETAVALIQAYVFTTLITLYLSEITK